MRAKWISELAVLAIGILAVQVGCSATDTPGQMSNKTAAAPATMPATMPAGMAAGSITPKEAKSYALGVQAIRNYQRLGADIDVEMMAKGMRDASAGGKLMLTEADIQNALLVFGGESRVLMAKARLNVADDNRKAGNEFLVKNRSAEGVVTLPSGLQYKVLQTGKGKSPTEADTVSVLYRGTLLDGTEFDSSSMAGEETTLTVSDPNIIAGFREALKLMPVGSQWRLFIPSQLAYGGVGHGRMVGPNATLIYDVTLLGIH